MNAYVRNITAMLIFGSVGLFVQAIPLSSSEIVAARTVLGSLFLCGMLVIRRQQPDWAALKKNLPMLIVTGIAGALIGMVLVNGTQTGGVDPQKGLVCGLLAAAFYAGLILLNKRITNVPATEKTLVQLLSAAVVMGAYSGPWELPQGTGLLALLIIGFVHTGIAYLLYISSMSELPGQTVALCSYIDPASALIFSAIFLHEHLTVLQLLGAVLILGGSAFGELYRKK